MKFTLSWLKEHLETEATLDDITYALTDLGMEVEGVENPAEALGAFRICRVIEALPHPNADRLRQCRVEVWPNGPDKPSEEVQVVCGAPNARTGLVGVFAPVGTHIPGTGVDLKPGVIRGVESNGMLCSERELMLSDDHDGIIDLPADAPMGMRFIDYARQNDPVIDIAITPNRPDALGVEGIARDLAARGLGVLKAKAPAAIKGGFASPVNVSIDADVQEKGCPVFCGRVIRGVKNGPSPRWLQDRLKAIGLRPISALVDITNFFTFDRNRPLHVFDVARVSGDLRVHWAEGGETLVALDDKEYTFEPGMMAISDDNGVESIAGVMGGLATGCTAETTDVFVESAYWDPVTIAATGRRLKINSDARYRFERGVDPAFTPVGLDLAVAMILDLCGGEASDMVVAGAVPDTARSYRLDTARVSSLVGMDIAAETQLQTLKALGFTLDGMDVSPPTWRPDVQGPADLVEEIARIASLTGLQGAPMPRVETGVTRPVLTPMQRREAVARRTTAALGYNECVTYSFVDQASAAMFGGGSDATMLANPISSEMSHMRPSLLPGLLQAASRNQARGSADLALFEVGPVFHGGEPEDQEMMLTGISVGHTVPRDAHGSRRPVDLYDAKADAEAVLAAIGAPAKLMIRRGCSGWWHPGRSALVTLGPKIVLGAFGELHPKVLDALGVKGPVVGFAIHIANLPFPKAKSATRPALELSALQAVDRDFAFVVDKEVEAEAILNAARSADKVLIGEVAVFDQFTGAKAEAQMGAGKKSVAITVHLQPVAATLTDKEIEAVSAKIITKVTAATGGTLRG
ncbi:MAG: phenylalanine--tRNA ligase subunit beta [Rhodobacteraceae bacterium]|nr:phenylalanine--tRNA ligase subunit beta [Paracoccaceae bacterium]